MRPERFAARTVAIAVAVLVAASESASAQQSCLMVGQIWSWKPLDRKSVIVENKIHQKFKVTFYGPCPNLEYNLGAAFVSRGNTQLDCLRRGDMLVHRGYGSGNQCPIKSVEFYAPVIQKGGQAAKAKGSY